MWGWPWGPQHRSAHLGPHLFLRPPVPGEWAEGGTATLHRQGMGRGLQHRWPSGWTEEHRRHGGEETTREMCWCGRRGGLPVPLSRAPLPATAHGCSRLDAAELSLSPPPQLRSEAQELGGDVTAAAFPPHPALQHCPPSLPGSEGGSRVPRGPPSGSVSELRA